MGNRFNKAKQFMLLAISVLFLMAESQAQDCNCVASSTDLTIINGETVVLNAYYPGDASAFAGSTSIMIGSKRTIPGTFTDSGGTIAIGDLLLVIQMQGVEIDPTLPDMETIDVAGADNFNFTDYGDGPGGLDNEGFFDNGSFIAGQYEFVIATNAIGIGGGTLTLQDALTNSYIANNAVSGNVGKRSFQVIKVGNFNDLTLDVGGEITTVPWNGSTGGVVTLDVLGTFTLNGIIDADFAGFRGGLLDPSVNNNDVEPGWRGEGIAGSPTQVFGYNDDFTALTNTTGLTTGYPGTAATVNSDMDFAGNVLSFDMTYTNERGPGAPGNAGGAGLVNNGGGGGSNGGAGGSGATSGDGAGGDFLVPAGGGGVLSLELGSRLYLGGGGGSGGMATPNNTGFPTNVVSGHPGGGGIIIRADTLTGSGTISVNGDDGATFNSVGTDVDDQDGAGGGGGAAGTILLVTSSEDISGVNFNAIGGDGSSMTGTQQFLSPDGGGGGGSGGNVTLVRRGGSFSPIPTNIDVSGGAAGLTQGTPSADSEGGDGATELLTTPPSSNLDCPLISLPAPAPGGVPGSIIWFAPDQNVTFNGSDQVTEWNDFSSSNFTLTNTSVNGITGTTPDYVTGSFTDSEIDSNPNFNFNPSISFNEGADQDDYLGFENFTNISTTGITTFAVVNIPTATANDQTIYSYLPNDAQDDELDLGISDDSGVNGIRKQTLDDPADRAGDLRDGVTRIIATSYDNADVNIYLNNGTATNVAQSAGALDVGGTFVLGQDLDDFGTPAFDNTRALRGQLADVLYFSRVITDTERQQVSSLLAIRYGITLDQTTDQDYLNSIGESVYPVVEEAANYAAYDNDIAGIGRDDGSRLSQLRSKSINTDAIITGSRITGFEADRQFIIWGNNDGGTTFNTTETSTGITNRIQREWRFAVSNAAEDIDLTFDLGGTSGTPSVMANLALVIDDDGDFSNGFLRTVSANSWDGSTAIFSDVELNDDEVVTIAEVPDAPGGAFSATLGLWLKGDAGITGISPVTAWSDQSGNLNGATALGNGPDLLENGINFNDVLDFDDTNTESLRGASGGAYTASYYLVVQPDDQITNVSGAQVPFGFDTPSANDNFGGLAFGGITGAFGGEVITHVVGGTSPRYRTGISGITLEAGIPIVIAVRDDADLATISDIFLGGVDSDDLLAETIISESDQNYDIGRSNTGNTFSDNFFDGKVAEILTYTSRISDTDHEKIQSYLAIKYGLTLDGNETNYIASDGDFIYETVVVPNDYNNDIAGVGRDDVGGLDQRKSLSVNTDAIVTIAITDNSGTFANPNLATTNLSFLAWGNDDDDNGVIEDVTTEGPGNVVTRLDREWRVQEKGTIGNVTVQIDISGVTPNGGGDFTARNTASFLLLIDDGGDFSNGITRSVEPTSYDAVSEVLTFDVDFVDGDIFTVATSLPLQGPGGITDNITLWLKADDGTSCTTANCDIATWNDQSGAGNNFAAVTSPSLTLDALNSNPVVTIDPSNDEFLSLTANLNPRSMFIVYRDRSTGSFTTPFTNASEGIGDGAADDTQLFDATLTPADVRNGDNFVNGSDIGDGITPAQPRPDDYEIHSRIFTSNPSNSSQEYTLGRDGAAADRDIDGDIAEVILYTDEITPAERQIIESYLAIKYGINLNGGDFDYTSSAGTVFYPGSSDSDFASFRNDIAIIGRDDNSDYEQLTSKSINSTSSLSVTKNEVFAASDQYISWGHNGAAISSSMATDFPSGTEGRLDREWKIKLTNAPTGTLDLTFDLTGATVASAADLRIVIDEDGDGDFSNATVISPTLTQDGNNFTFAGVDLSSFSDGALFTVASIDNSETPLPLDFLSFSAEEIGGDALLKWTTTNEINVYHFEIERSGNGIDFQRIGDVRANNVSDGINSYEFVDNNPIREINYYRIKEVDFDGAFEYTGIEFVIISGGDWQVTVYPNPASNTINITTTLPTSGRMKVIDISGKVIMDYPTRDDRRNRLDISNLETGIYQLEFDSILGVQRVRFIKKN